MDLCSVSYVLCRLHAATAGRGRGKPLMLFLHGWPELWFSWRTLMALFMDDYEVQPHTFPGMWLTPQGFCQLSSSHACPGCSAEWTKLTCMQGGGH